MLHSSKWLYGFFQNEKDIFSQKQKVSERELRLLTQDFKRYI